MCRGRTDSKNGELKVRLPVAGLSSTSERSLSDQSENEFIPACGILGALGQPRVLGMSDEELAIYLVGKNVVDPEIDLLH
jgi:hypothetical protein